LIYEKFVPDVFLCPYQQQPLDLYGNEFYEHRKADIDARMNEIQNWGDDEAAIFIQEMWEQHRDKESIVNWNLIRDIDQAKARLLLLLSS
jgi:hypothetical protein